MGLSPTSNLLILEVFYKVVELLLFLKAVVFIESIQIFKKHSDIILLNLIYTW